MVALLILPFLAIASAGIVVLVTLREGWRRAAQDVAVAMVALAAAAALMSGNWVAVLGGAAATWLMAIVVAELHRTGSLNLAVQATILLGLAGAALFLWSHPDPQLYWEGMLGELIAAGGAAGLEVLPQDLLPRAASVMTGVVAASIAGSAICALCLGCWWAGESGQPGIGDEWRELRLGRILGLIAAGVAVLLVLGRGDSADDLALVIGSGFVLQGLAVLHWLAARRKWPTIWPWAVYLPLALVPMVGVVEVMLLAVLGLVDNSFDLRRPGPGVV
jgi:hypothetical protein